MKLSKIDFQTDCEVASVVNLDLNVHSVLDNQRFEMLQEFRSKVDDLI